MRGSVATSSARASGSDIVRSDGSPDHFALDRDLPTTVGEVAALRRLRPAPAATADDLAPYLRFLASMPAVWPETVRARPGPAGPPFVLEVAR
jgi:hypothetical protein